MKMIDSKQEEEKENRILQVVTTDHPIKGVCIFNYLGKQDDS